MKRESQSRILPHTQAKLDLFQKYLWKYLIILSYAKSINEINIYDIFCGAGIYEDGKEGSPIIAFNLIKQIKDFFSEKELPNKKIELIVNDVDFKNIESVDSYFNSQLSKDKTDYSYRIHKLDAEEMFREIIEEKKKQSKYTRNLILLDPYGYKNIQRDHIFNLMANDRTEILLFLPVSFMQRFKNIALESDKKCYEHLQKFINNFFPEKHPIRQPENITTLEFIDFIEKALSFDGKYFSLAHSIERSKNNYFAVFFITAHIFGFEKMLETKWELDEDYGKGFRIKKDELTLFDDYEKEEIRGNNFNFLRQLVLDLLEKNDYISNIDLYPFVLKNGFLVKHLNAVLKELFNNKKIIVWNVSKSDQLKKVRSFYISFNYYRTNKPILFIRKGS